MLPEHWIHKYEVDHVDEEHGQDPDGDPNHNLYGHHRPRLMLADATWTESVFQLLRRPPVKSEHGNHHVLAVAVGGGHG